MVERSQRAVDKDGKGRNGLTLGIPEQHHKRLACLQQQTSKDYIIPSLSSNLYHPFVYALYIHILPEFQTKDQARKTAGGTANISEPAPASSIIRRFPQTISIPWGRPNEQTLSKLCNYSFDKDRIRGGTSGYHSNISELGGGALSWWRTFIQNINTSGNSRDGTLRLKKLPVQHQGL